MSLQIKWLGLWSILLYLLACAPQIASKAVQSPSIEPTLTAATSPSPEPAKLVPAKLFPAKLGNHKLQLELALTPEARQKGLMFRKTLPENQGMLFVFEKEQTLSFWMKNTLIPLSIAYLDKSLKIIDIQDMMPLDESSHPSRHPAQYALELNQGWFKTHQIQTGTVLELDTKLLQKPQPQ